MSAEISEKEIQELVIQILQTSLRFNEEIVELRTQRTRLNRERIEIDNWSKTHVFNRLESFMTNPAVLKRMEDFLKIYRTSFTTMHELDVFDDKLILLFQSIETEDAVSKQHLPSSDQKTLKSMSIQDLKVVMDKWINRKKLVQDWKIAMNGLVAKWDQHLSVEFRKTYSNCAFNLDLLTEWIMHEQA